MRTALLCLLLAACAADNGDDAMDIHDPGPLGTLRADGTWALNVTYLSGSCDQTGTHDLTLTVVDATSGYAITADDPLTITGTTTCTKTGCTLDLSASDTSAAGDPVFAFTVTGSSALSVVGQGTLTIGGLSACSETYSINGTWTPVTEPDAGIL
jgi:hypothetical protein